MAYTGTRDRCNRTGRTVSLPKIFHAKDVKEYLGISLNKTYQILENGELKGTKCGSRWLIPETSLIEYLGLETDNPAGSELSEVGEYVDLPAALRGDRCD